MIRAELSLKHLIRPAADGIEKPPVIVMLHGVGSNEEDLFALTPYLPEQFQVISARAPITLQPGAYAWYHVDFQPDRMTINADEEASSRQMIPSFIDEAIAAYGGDRDRVFLLGFSQGAILSMGLLLTQPDKVSGVVAMSGRLLDEVVPQIAPPEALKDKPLMMVHGVADAVIPIRYARQALETLRKLPLKLFYREYGMAHQISEESLTDMLGWLEDKI